MFHPRSRTFTLTAVAVAIAACGSSPADLTETPDPDDPIPSRGTVSTITMSAVQGFDGIYMDPNGRLFGGGGWQSDKVFEIGPDGALTVFSDGHGGPIHMVMGGDGHYYVTNYTDGTLRRVAPDGSTNDIIGENLDGPSGATVGPDGRVYVVSWGASGAGGTTVWRVEDDLTVTEHFKGGGVFTPQGVAADEDGNLYVANAQDARIHRITPDGTITLLTTLPIQGTYNIAHMVYMGGKLYATGAAKNGFFEIWTDTGNFRKWGTGAATNVDGELENASFSSPTGIAAGPDGKTLYMQVTPRNLIRKVVFN